MLCTCPACGFPAPLLSFTAEQAAGEFASLMGRVPPQVAHLVEQYLQMFATPKHKPTFAKAVRVLAPLVQVIEAGTVQHAKREWAVTLPQIGEGLAYMVSRRAELTLPLKSHGYLWKVLAGATDKAEAQAEAKGIEQQRTGQDKAAASQGPSKAELTAAQQVRAISALTAELAACRRLKTPPNREAISQQLARQGYSQSDVHFAFSKVPFKGSSTQE